MLYDDSLMKCQHILNMMILNGGQLIPQTEEYIVVELTYSYDGRKISVTNNTTNMYYELYIRGAELINDVNVHIFPDEDNTYTDGDIINMVHSIVYQFTENKKRQCFPRGADMLSPKRILPITYRR